MSSVVSSRPYKCVRIGGTCVGVSGFTAVQELWQCSSYVSRDRQPFNLKYLRHFHSVQHAWDDKNVRLHRKTCKKETS